MSDVERSKAFYASLGWRLDADFGFDNGFRVVQFTPPGSGASIQFGTKISTAAPGSAQGLYLVVSDVSAARDELAARGADISEVFHPSAPGGQFEPAGRDARAAGMDEHHASYGSFATLHDPDGNTWLLQEVTTRLPGRIDDDATSYASIADLAERDATRLGRPRPARGPDRRGRCELARLVRGLHGRRTGRHASCRNEHHTKGVIMSTIKMHATTTATPEQYTAGLTDFGPGRSKIFGNSADSDLKVHDRARVTPTSPRVPAASGNAWPTTGPIPTMSSPARPTRTHGAAGPATRTRSRATPTARPTSTTSWCERARTSRASSSASSSAASARAVW